jgi:hypothetical protein
MMGIFHIKKETRPGLSKMKLRLSTMKLRLSSMKLNFIK